VDEAMVERVAKAMYETTINSNIWGNEDNDLKNDWRNAAKAAIAALTPNQPINNQPKGD